MEFELCQFSPNINSRAYRIGEQTFENSKRLLAAHARSSLLSLLDRRYANGGTEYSYSDNYCRRHFAERERDTRQFLSHLSVLDTFEPSSAFFQVSRICNFSWIFIFSNFRSIIASITYEETCWANFESRFRSRLIFNLFEGGWKLKLKCREELLIGGWYQYVGGNIYEERISYARCRSTRLINV